MPKRDNRVVIWPAYINSENTRGEGRKIARHDAVSNPTAEDILIAAMEMNLQPEPEKDKHYPKTWWEKSGRIVVSKKSSKTDLMREIATRIKRRRKKG